MRPLIFICLILVAVQGRCADATPPARDTGDHARRDHEEDSLLALRNAFDAYRFTAGFGGNAGINSGFGGLLMASYQRNHYLFSALYQTSGTIHFGGPESPDESAQSYGLLVGAGTMFPHTFLSASAGIGYANHVSDLEKLDSDFHIITYGHSETRYIMFPINVQAMLTFSSGFGAGLCAYGNIGGNGTGNHRFFSDYGFGFNVQFGVWEVTVPTVHGQTASSRDGDTMTFAGPRGARNTFYLELMGSGFLITLHYDRLINEHWSASAGVSIDGLAGYSTYRELILPVSIHYFSLPRNGGWEGAVGYTADYYLSQPGNYGRPSGLLTSFVGYRYQEFNGGEFIRLGLAPVYFISDKLFAFFNFSVCGGITF